MRSLEEVIEVKDAFSVTLEEALVLYGTAIACLEEETSAGEISIQTTSDGLYSRVLMRERLLSCLGQATVAHSQLQFWLTLNGYATTLPLKTLLQNCTLGCVRLLELIDALGLAVSYRDQLLATAPELPPTVVMFTHLF